MNKSREGSDKYPQDYTAYEIDWESFLSCHFFVSRSGKKRCSKVFNSLDVQYHCIASNVCMVEQWILLEGAVYDFLGTVWKQIILLS